MLKAAGAGALLALIAGSWYFNVATGGSELAAAGDTLGYYAPQYAAAGAAWREAGLPLWNAHQLCGHPWLATLQGGILYPGHVLYVLLPTHLGMAASSLLHLMIVGAGMAVLARRLGLSGWAALLAACLYSLNGPLPPQSATPNMLEAAAWLPAGAVAVSGLVRSGNPGWTALLALSLALSLLAGYPQYSVYTCYTWAGLLVVLLVDERPSPRTWLAPCAGFAVAIGIGVLLASLQLLAAFELTRESSRSLGAVSFEAMFPTGWPKASILHATGWLLATAPPFGFSAVLLLPLALFHSQRRRVLGLLAMLLVVFGIAIGPASPLFDVYLLLPGVESFRLPTRRLLFVVGFLLALLAAFGVDQLLRWTRSQLGVSAAHALGAAVLAAALTEPFLNDAPRADLHYGAPEYAQAFPQERELFEKIAGENRVLFWSPGVQPPLPAKLAGVFGVRAFDDYEPMSLRLQDSYFSYLARGSVRSSQRSPFYGRLHFPKSLPAAREMAGRRRLLDLASVRHLVAANRQRENQIFHTFARAAGFVREPLGPKLQDTSPIVYRNEKALPRSYVTYRAATAPPAETLLPLLAAPDFDPLASSYVAGSPVGQSTTNPAYGHPAKIERDEPTRIEIVADLASEGLLVLSDSYYPGWQVSVDGQPREILAANHLFRGVVLKAGPHRIVFRYRPSWLTAGRAASLLGLVALAGLAMRGYALRRRPAGALPTPVLLYV
jgi:hypothetical protein